MCVPYVVLLCNNIPRNVQIVPKPISHVHEPLCENGAGYKTIYMSFHTTLHNKQPYLGPMFFMIDNFYPYTLSHIFFFFFLSIFNGFNGYS